MPKCKNLITVHFDGICIPHSPTDRGGVGIIIQIPGKKTYRKGKHIGNTNMSCNVAEYEALFYALCYLKDKGLTNEPIKVFGDSQLVIYQMSGKWKIKKGLYKEVALTVQELARDFSRITYKWIRRERNKEADFLSYKAVKNFQRGREKWARR